MAAAEKETHCRTGSAAAGPQEKNLGTIAAEVAAGLGVCNTWPVAVAAASFAVT